MCFQSVVQLKVQQSMESFFICMVRSHRNAFLFIPKNSVRNTVLGLYIETSDRKHLVSTPHIFGNRTLLDLVKFTTFMDVYVSAVSTFIFVTFKNCQSDCLALSFSRNQMKQPSYINFDTTDVAIVCHTTKENHIRPSVEIPRICSIQSMHVLSWLYYGFWGGVSKTPVSS